MLLSLETRNGLQITGMAAILLSQLLCMVVFFSVVICGIGKIYF